MHDGGRRQRSRQPGRSPKLDNLSDLHNNKIPRGGSTCSFARLPPVHRLRLERRSRRRRHDLQMLEPAFKTSTDPAGPTTSSSTANRCGAPQAGPHSAHGASGRQGDRGRQKNSLPPTRSSTSPTASSALAATSESASLRPFGVEQKSPIGQVPKRPTTLQDAARQLPDGWDNDLRTSPPPPRRPAATLGQGAHAPQDVPWLMGGQPTRALDQDPPRRRRRRLRPAVSPPRGPHRSPGQKLAASISPTRPQHSLRVLELAMGACLRGLALSKSARSLRVFVSATSAPRAAFGDQEIPSPHLHPRPIGVGADGPTTSDRSHGQPPRDPRLITIPPRRRNEWRGVAVIMKLKHTLSARDDPPALPPSTDQVRRASGVARARTSWPTSNAARRLTFCASTGSELSLLLEAYAAQEDASRPASSICRSGL